MNNECILSDISRLKFDPPLFPATQNVAIPSLSDTHHRCWCSSFQESGRCSTPSRRRCIPSPSGKLRRWSNAQLDSRTSHMPPSIEYPCFRGVATVWIVRGTGIEVTFQCKFFTKILGHFGGGVLKFQTLPSHFAPPLSCYVFTNSSSRNDKWWWIDYHL